MSTHDGRRLYRAAGLMTIGTAMSRITGLVRVAAMAYALGIVGTRLADTYNLANTTPNIVYELFLGGILTSVFVPVLIETRERKERDVSALISVSLLALAAVSAIAAVGAPLIMRIYTFRIEDPVVRAQQLELATYLLRWFAPQIFFYGLSAIAEALLNVRGRFAPPKFAPVLNNVLVAGTLFAYAHLFSERTLQLSGSAKLLLGAGTTAGVVVQALVLLPYLRGEHLRLKIDFRDPAVARVVRLAVFVLGYVVVNQIGLWVVLALANGVTGGVASWGIAFTFFQLPHGLFAVSLQSALFPDLSRAAGIGDWTLFRSRFSSGVRGVVYLLLPAAIGYAVLAHPITRLVLARGVSGVKDAAAVASLVQVFAAGLVFYSLFHLLTRCFYALHDTRTPTTVNAVAVAASVAVDIPLFFRFGVRGLAMGHALSYMVGSALLATLLARRIPGGLGSRALGRPLARIAIPASAMGICVLGLSRLLDGPDVLVVGVCVGAGAILYLAFSQVAGVEEREILLGFLRARNRTEEGGPA
jgi:putative peptidoglycan lipid II flippase